LGNFLASEFCVPWLCLPLALIYARVSMVWSYIAYAMFLLKFLMDLVFEKQNAYGVSANPCIIEVLASFCEIFRWRAVKKAPFMTSSVPFIFSFSKAGSFWGLAVSSFGVKFQ
jgi:hypothetical protein